MLILRYFTEIVGKLFDGKAENVILYQPGVERRFAVAHIAGVPIPMGPLGSHRNPPSELQKRQLHSIKPRETGAQMT